MSRDQDDKADLTVQKQRNIQDEQDRRDRREPKGQEPEGSTVPRTGSDVAIVYLSSHDDAKETCRHAKPKDNAVY